MAVTVSELILTLQLKVVSVVLVGASGRVLNQSLTSFGGIHGVISQLSPHQEELCFDYARSGHRQESGFVQIQGFGCRRTELLVRLLWSVLPECPRFPDQTFLWCAAFVAYRLEVSRSRAQRSQINSCVNRHG